MKMSTEPIGAKFGRLLVLGRNPQNSADNRAMWNCLCDCGKKITAREKDIRSGKQKSCGCLKREQVIERSTRHGCSHAGQETREYKAWQNMKTRCMNPNSKKYESYGARGIRICQPWLDDFNNFLSDMGPCPPRHMIERIDNDGDYEPGNCKWATNLEQSRNKRTNRWIEFDGKKMILHDWAKEIGICHASLLERLEKWPLEKALTQPAGKNNG